MRSKGLGAVLCTVVIGLVLPAAALAAKPAATTGTALGKRRSFTTKAQPLGVSLTATPNPVPAKNTATLLKGTLSGTNHAGRRVVLQSSTWPYTVPFQNGTNEQVTDANGNFEFPLLAGVVTQNVQFRVLMPQHPEVVSPIVLLGVKPSVKSKVSKHRVQRGHLVRFSGSITPRAADQQVAFQKKHNGQWVTVGGVTRLRSGKFSKDVRVRRGGTFRVWTGSSAGQYASNVGKKIRIKTFR